MNKHMLITKTQTHRTWPLTRLQFLRRPLVSIRNRHRPSEKLREIPCDFSPPLGYFRRASGRRADVNLSARPRVSTLGNRQAVHTHVVCARCSWAVNTTTPLLTYCLLSKLLESSFILCWRKSSPCASNYSSITGLEAIVVWWHGDRRLACNTGWRLVALHATVLEGNFKYSGEIYSLILFFSTLCWRIFLKIKQ